MITWIQVWPILGVPWLLIAGVAALPTAAFGGRTLGGGPVREWLLNHWLLPVLPHDAAASLVAWFQQAGAAQEWLIAALIALNANAVLLPVLYGIGLGVIRINNALTNKDIELKRRAAR